VWDLGISDSTVLWFFQVVPGEIRVIDFYENNGQKLQHYVQEIAARGYKQGDDWVPHDARVRSLDTGRTRVETLISLSRRPRVVSDQKLMDGINAARLVLPVCWFDRDKCRDGLEALRQYRADYDEQAKMFRDRPRHDWASHAADGFRYLALAYREMKAPPAPDEKQELVRARQQRLKERQKNKRKAA
jgi:phage terminase large subunit